MSDTRLATVERRSQAPGDECVAPTAWSQGEL